MASFTGAYTCLLVHFFAVTCVTIVDSGSFSIDYENNTFLKDGKPFRYVSGSIHYSRIHPYYWKDRLLKAKMAGLSAIQTYVPWNFHEVTPDQYTFSDEADLPGFLSIANELDLLVLLRAGPYICAEWDFGGFPAWLLTLNKNMILRTSDPTYIDRVDKWFTALLMTVKPYLYENGGPIIMVQIENEYGSYFACDFDYLHFLYNKTRSILGPNVVIYTTDGSGDNFLKCGKIKEAYATVDFGVTYDASKAFQPQRNYEPRGPLVNSEFYTGWLDSWGQPHTTVDKIKFAKSLDILLDYGANVNMYMFEGGTNFGYTGGALDPPYLPTVTSYDEDAPLNEAGDTTLKYFAIRDVISKYYSLPVGHVPPNTLKGNYGETQMVFISTLQDALSTLCPEGPIMSTYPMSMEAVNHYYGFILYRHMLKADVNNAELVTYGVRDRGYVMVDQKPQGMFYRRDVVKVSITGSAGQYLDILVENQGRVCYSTSMNFMTKGLIYNVTLDGVIVSQWEIYRIHLEHMLKLINLRSSKSVVKMSSSGDLMTPAIYMGKINIPFAPDQTLDTFLDMRPWVKGQAFINNFNVGRYWPQKGPQVTLYLPAPLFSAQGSNELWVLELEHSPCFSSNKTACRVSFTDVPYIDAKPTGKDLKVVSEWTDGTRTFQGKYWNREQYLKHSDLSP